MKNRGRLAFVGVAVLALAAGLWAGTRGGSPSAVKPAAELLYAQSWPDSQGRTDVLSSLKGQVAVLNFWAPWCAPCVKEMPELQALADEFAAKSVHFVGIGIDSAERIAEFQAKHRIRFPLVVANAAGTELARQFGNQAGGLPYTVVLDKAGAVRYTHLGPITTERLRSALTALGL